MLWLFDDVLNYQILIIHGHRTCHDARTHIRMSRVVLAWWRFNLNGIDGLVPTSFDGILNGGGDDTGGVNGPFAFDCLVLHYSVYQTLNQKFIHKSIVIGVVWCVCVQPGTCSYTISSTSTLFLCRKSSKHTHYRVVRKFNYKLR